MNTRTRNNLVVFHHPFELRGVDRTLPAGEYRVMTDEQLIEELSFPVYRRVSTVIFAPGQSPNSSSVEMVTIDPRDLQAAQDRDGAWLLARSQTVSTVRAFGHPQGMRRTVPTTEKRIDLDQRHGMAAQKATYLRVAIGYVRLTSI